MWGIDRGFCLMIGGEADIVEHLRPIFATIAPGLGSVPRTPGRTGDPDDAELGFLHCGPNGAGHFVKMVHNGIEYGMMASFAEGLNILHNANAGKSTAASDAETAPLEEPEFYQYDIDTTAVAEVWRRGSVVESWLLDLTATALFESPDLGELRRSGVGLGRGPLDLHRRHRRGRPRSGAHRLALLPLRLAGSRRLRQQGPLGHAQGIRRPRRETGLTARVGPGGGPTGPPGPK